MTDETSESSAASEKVLIKSVNQFDILLGRGSGSSQFDGNKYFRRLVDERKDEYVSAEKNKTKNRIAKEVFDHIRSRGGRFLKQVAVSSSDDASYLEASSWYEVEEAVALEKCMQSLREIREKKRPPDGIGNVMGHSSLLTNRLRGTPSAAFMSQQPTALDGGVALNGLNGFSSWALSGGERVLPNTLLGHGALPAPLSFTPASVNAIDARLSLFHLAPFAVQQQQPPMVIVPDSRYLSHLATLRSPNVLPQNDMYVSNERLQQGLVNRSQSNVPVSTNGNSSTDNVARNLPSSSAHGEVGRNLKLNKKRRKFGKEEDDISTSRSSGSSFMSVDEASEHDKQKDGKPKQEEAVTQDHSQEAPSWPKSNTSALLQLCSLERLPKFTEEQAAAEQAALTDEERAAALADLFGERCAVSTRENKRARTDLDAESIAFLLKQMRLEVDRIPNDKKQALLEAQRKCHADEFRDQRLEHFLRCEGMNVKLAAQRFVNYWENRRQVFGPEKYTMRMTLSEALRDDLVALEAGFCCLLPTKDSSGRQLLFWEASRHTNKGYTSDSMLRAIWYVMEVAALENDDVSRANVHVSWERGLSLWNYDSKLDDRVIQLHKFSWPVKIIACHVCCVPGVLIRILKPVLLAMLDTFGRSRLKIHDTPDDQVLGVLSGYGIEKEMLPTVMGGALEFDQSEWIANRRAVELEEI